MHTLLTPKKGIRSTIFARQSHFFIAVQLFPAVISAVRRRGSDCMCYPSRLITRLPNELHSFVVCPWGQHYSHGFWDEQRVVQVLYSLVNKKPSRMHLQACNEMLLPAPISTSQVLVSETLIPYRVQRNTAICLIHCIALFAFNTKPRMTKISLVKIALLLFLACGATAAPAVRKLYSSDNDLISFSDRQTSTVYAIRDSEPAALLFANQGVTLSVVRDMRASADYNLEFDGVDASVLNSKDSSFISTLSASERTKYLQAKSDYIGGLRIPLLDFIGINLEDMVTQADMDASATSQANYNAKAAAVKQIIESATVTTQKQSGTISAEGQGVLPSTIRSFLGFETARVYLQNGKSIIVFARPVTSFVLPSDDGSDINIIP